MASNLTSPGTYSVNNMLIDPGEQLDAIFLQKLAENTAWLRARQQPWLFNSGGTTGTSRTMTGENELGLQYDIPVMRVKGHNRLHGTFHGTVFMSDADSPDVTFSHGFQLFGDLGTYNGLASGTHGNLGSAVLIGTTYRFSFDLDSYLSEGAWGTFAARAYGTSRDSGSPETVTFQFGVPCLLHTDWT